MGITLHELCAEAQRIRTMIENYEESCVDQETGEVKIEMFDLASLLDSVEINREKKLLSCAGYVKDVLAEAEAFRAEEVRLQARRKPLEAKADRLRDYMIAHMNKGEKLQDETASISWRKSEGVVIDDESMIPERFMRIKREVAKSELKKALKDDIPIYGARIEVRQNLQIQ